MLRQPKNLLDLWTWTKNKQTYRGKQKNEHKHNKTNKRKSTDEMIAKVPFNWSAARRNWQRKRNSLSLPIPPPSLRPHLNPLPLPDAPSTTFTTSLAFSRAQSYTRIMSGNKEEIQQCSHLQWNPLYATSIATSKSGRINKMAGLAGFFR